MSNKHEGILVISCDDFPAENIILRIIDKSSLPETSEHLGVKGYPWNFDTKYYSAEVYLYTLKQKEELNLAFFHSIKALIFYFDCKTSSSLEEVLDWIPYLKEVNAEVQLLIHNDKSDEVQIKNALNWCVKNQFELIQLNCASDSSSDNEEEPNAEGYARVVEALQSHPWANLVMKNSKSKENVNKEKEKTASPEKESSGAEGNVENVHSKAKTNTNSTKIDSESKDLEVEEKWLSDVLDGQDTGGESFEALFQRFASMKDRASGLSGEERKKYAEKVAIEFWRAMGGDEDEIEGLDDD